MRKMFSAPSRATAAALYRRVEEESNEFSSRLTTHAANSNMSLNRWNNILPYDATRVVILPQSSANNLDNGGANSVLQTDYINANHIRVPEAAKHYILTQGPIDKDDQRQRTLSSSMMFMLGSSIGGANVRSETVPHFWTMVWQQKSPAIVMLCRTHERDAYGCLQCKCARYWPKSTSEADIIKLYDLEVRLLEEHALKLSHPTDTSKENSTTPTVAINDLSTTDSALNQQCTIKRRLEVRKISTSEKRVVTQYHYQKWPDFGVPEGEEVNNFLKLVNIVSQEHPSTEERPNIIHCSAGVGRSGTFCLVNSCLERMTKSGVPITQDQVIDTLLHMRHQRMGLIQTDDQLRFALLAISSGADDALEKAKQLENLNDLKTSSKKLTDVPCNATHSKQNSAQLSSITDVENVCNENGVIMAKNEASGLKNHTVHYVDGVRAISTNVKSRIKDGNGASNLARKRSTDLGTDEADRDISPERSLNEAGANISELNEALEDKIRNISGDNTSSRSTAKRKKSEKDC